MNLPSKLFAAALVAAVTPWLVAPAAAVPMAAPLAALQSEVATPFEAVQYRRGWRRGGGWRHRGRGHGGAGIGLGIVAGAIIGGAIANSQPAYAPGYDGAVSYCAQRFRSYDPRSGTYLGFDGLRHPCP